MINIKNYKYVCLISYGIIPFQDDSGMSRAKRRRNGNHSDSNSGYTSIEVDVESEQEADMSPGQ
jgi:hypothetical protein